MVPEGRRVFPFMTVKDNLLMGAFTRTTRPDRRQDLTGADALPAAEGALSARTAGTLSGGEQQMLVIGRALMASPKLLLLDEPSLGIAPKLVQDIARSIVAINREENSRCILVEQNSRMALKISNRAYAMSIGSVVMRACRGAASDDRIRAPTSAARSAMRILVINPNTTASMTEKIGAARAAARRHRDHRGNPASGPPSIEGYYDEAISPAASSTRSQAQPEASTPVIACFDDTGIDAARELDRRGRCSASARPAFHMAPLIAAHFSVVTTLPRSVPRSSTTCLRYGLAARCRRRARRPTSPVLALEQPGGDARGRIAPRSRARSRRTAPRRSCSAAPA